METTLAPLAATLPTALPAANFSVLSLFLQADMVVKLVMLLLVFASLWSWTIIFSKIITLGRIRTLSSRFEEHFWAATSLDAVYERTGNRPRDPISAVFCAAMAEWRRSFTRGRSVADSQGMVHQRVERLMHMTVGREMGRLEKHMGFLASVGSTAPFVGLFGRRLRRSDRGDIRGNAGGPVGCAGRLGDCSNYSSCIGRSIRRGLGSGFHSGFCGIQARPPHFNR